MRVLLITGVYPPDIGGPAKYISELAEFLVNSGIKTEVITLKDNITKTKKNNWPVFSKNFDNIFGDNFGNNVGNSCL
jgi:hypothetical protein